MATTTPNYGWDVPTSTDYVKDGALAIETLGDDIDASLFSITNGKKVGSSLIYNSSFSGANNYNFYPVFSADYDNYYITIQNLQAAAGTPDVYARINNNNTPLTSSTYYASVNFGNYSAATGGYINSNAASAYYVTNVGTDGRDIEVFVGKPFLAQYTTFYTRATGNSSYIAGGGLTTNQNSHNGFTIFSLTGTNLSGTIRIYGLRNS